MSKINYLSYLLSFFLLGGLLSACQMTLVKDVSEAFSSSSSSSPNTTDSTDSSVKTQPTQSHPHGIFSELLPKLQAQTKLPILLPAYIPESESSEPPPYALLESANSSEYQIQLAFTEDCNGANACHLGSIVAEAITSESAALTGETVALANGVTGYFTDATCGASCSDATLVWEQDLVRYTIAIKAGRVETLVKMANSALATVQ